MVGVSDPTRMVGVSDPTRMVGVSDPTRMVGVSQPHAGAHLDSSRTREILRRLELDITRRLDGILHGDHQGLVPGHGSEPGEARGYQAGDDVRRIDWNVSARSQNLHVRDTVADRELECWIIADRSASLGFGTADIDKSDLALAAAGAVGFLAARGGNRVGAVISTGSGATAPITVPPRQGRSHVLGILSRLPDASDQSATDLGPLLHHASVVIRRRGMVAVVSDFLDAPGTWANDLARLGVRQQVLAIEVVDPRELELPGVGMLTLIDTETGRTREINTSSASLRARYAEAAAEQRSEIARAIRRSGADHIVLRTDHDWLGTLARHLTSARRRRTAGAVRVGAVGAGRGGIR